MSEPDITASELRDALDRGEKLAIYDVRRSTDREWTIPGAIPLDIHDRLWANDSSALADFHPPAGKKVVFVCGRGNTSLLAANQEFIGPMRTEELRQAIEMPARLGRWEFAPGLVDLILHDVGGAAEPLT